MQNKLPTAVEIDEQQLIFGLDIGTRSVIGLVGLRDGERLRILAAERVEHEKRAMLDGQIEDIAQVAKIVGKIKGSLEEKLGVRLKTVAVAAAGRALRVENASISRSFEQKKEIDAELIAQLESQAIEQAVLQLQEGREQEEIPVSFYCVGHSIAHQAADGYEFSSLLGHKCNQVSMEIIATFLPSSVVESLHAVVERNGMEISCMTLEPIAAMNALIPKELRALNLALVDIGAGTADIALSRAGSILSYDMATVAGDEITEAISQGLLVDFDTAERLKRELGQPKENFVYQDILRVEYTMSRQQLLDVVENATERLCATICETITRVNSGSPAAVFLVGGGSLLPNLCERVAEKLSLPPAKVAVGQTPYFREMVVEAQDVRGPEYMTPLGIVITNFLSQGYGLYSVTLNGKQVKIFNDRNLIVGAILVAGGIALHQMVGAPGTPLTFMLDGQSKTVRGGISAPGRITINDQASSINSPIKVGDVVEVIPAQSGQHAQIKLESLFDYSDKGVVTVSGHEVPLGLSVLVNGVEQPMEYQVKQGDIIQSKRIRLVRDVAASMSVPSDHVITINGAQAGLDAPLMDGDVVSHAVPVPIKAKTEGISILVNGQEQILPLKERNAPYIFADALMFVDIDQQKPQGVPVIKLNGREASYSETIRQDDKIVIEWK